jgi:diacylglycerol kinase (ATP)
MAPAAAARPPGPSAIFLNEGAGSATSTRVRRAVALVRTALDADLHVTASRDPAELTAWMSERLGDYRTVVAAGGDGSLGVAYNVVAGRDVTVGYLPAGFGNATAHLLRLPRDADELASVISAGDARPVDLVSVDGRLALFAGAGWDARVAGRYAAAGARKWRGWAAAVTRSMPDLVRRPSVVVEADGEVVHEGPMELLVVGTTPWFGRGLLVNPGARIDAGRLMLRVFPGPLPVFALEAVRWAARRQPAAPGHTARSVRLNAVGDTAIPVQADGDLIGERASWEFAISPAAVRLIGRW